MSYMDDMIIYYIKIFVMNIYVIYCFRKISNRKKFSFKYIIIFNFINIIFSAICTYIEFYIDPFLLLLIVSFFFGIILSKLLKEKIGYSLVISFLSYSICVICIGIATIAAFIPYKLININNNYINLVCILICQFVFIYTFFKIKRFKNGFNYLNRNLNKDFNELITINISTIVIFMYCLIGTIINDELTKNMLVSFIILGITLFVIIKKSITMYYKQKLLQDNLQQYKNDLDEKDQELQKIKDEKYKISKLTHEFYNRQKALELAVIENTQNKDLINRIHNLTEEYSEELTKIKMPDQLPETGIEEIDDMFKYMQKECNEKNIKFELKVEGNIYHLVNNIIPKNKLETLIGDHIRDAINAVNREKVENKEILVIIGIKDNKYELCIYDTGIEFKKETLLKLGQENVTTNKDKGGQGIGYMTTFETLNQTGASLIIEEYETGKGNNYTKAVKFRFDGKREYKICSYRADEIKKENKDRNIIIEEI